MRLRGVRGKDDSMALHAKAHIGPISALSARKVGEEEEDDEDDAGGVDFASGPVAWLGSDGRRAVVPDRESIHGIAPRGAFFAVHTAYSVLIFCRDDDGGRGLGAPAGPARDVRLVYQSAADVREFILDMRWRTATRLLVVRSRGIAEEFALRGEQEARSSCWERLPFPARCEERGVMWSASIWINDSRDAREGGEGGRCEVASGSSLGPILLWSPKFAQPATSMSPVHRLHGHRGPVFALQFSKNGDLLASCGDDRSIRVWRRIGGRRDRLFCSFEQVRVFWGHLARVWDVAFVEGHRKPSEDDNGSHVIDDGDENDDEDARFTVVSVAEDRSCRTWDENGLLDVRLGHAGRNVRKVAIGVHHGVETIFTGGDDASVKLGPVRKSRGTEASLFPLLFPAEERGGGKREAVRTILLRGQANAIVTTDFGRILTVDFAPSKAPVWTERYRSEALRYSPDAAAISPDGSLLAVGSASGVVAVHSAAAPPPDRDGTTKATGWHAERPPVEDLTVAMEDVTAGSPRARNDDEEAEGSFPLLQLLPPSFKGLVIAVYFLEERLFVADPHGWVYVYVSHVRNRVSCDFQQVGVLRNPTGSVLTRIALTPTRILCGDRRGRLLSFARAAAPAAAAKAPDPNSGPPTAASIPPGEYEFPLCSSIKLHTDRVVAIVVSEDDQVVISAAADGSIASLDLTGESLGWQSRCHERVNTTDRVFRVRGDLFTAGFRSTKFALWNLTARTELAVVECGGWRRPHDLHVVDGDPRRVHSTEARNLSNTVSFHGSRVNDMCFVEDRCLVTVSEDTTCKVLHWGGGSDSGDGSSRSSAGGGQQLAVQQTLHAHVSGVHAVAFDPEHRILYTGGGKNELMSWSVSNDSREVTLLKTLRNRQKQTVGRATDRITAIAYVRDGTVVVGRSNGTLSLYEYKPGSGPSLCAAGSDAKHLGAVKTIAAGADGLILTGDTSGCVMLWQVAKEKGLVERAVMQEAHALGVNGICMKATGATTIAATCGDDQSVAFWEIQGSTLKLVSRKHDIHCAAVTSIVCSDDGSTFVSVGADRKAIVWKARKDGDGSGGLVVDESDRQITTVADPSTVVINASNCVAITGIGLELMQLNYR